MEFHMAIANTDNEGRNATDEAGANKLRGGALDGSEQKRAVDHTQYAKKRNPDDVVRADGEEDTLYNDGLELEDDTPPMGTSSSYDKAPE
jgi:hypothetical protein